VIQIAFQLFHFVYIVYTTFNYTPPLPAPLLTPWQKYQMVYASYFNSGVATVGHMVVRKTEQEITKKKTKWALFVVAPLFLTWLPFLCTHALPMIIYYAWISIPLFLIGLAAAAMMRKLTQHQITWFTLILLMILEVVYFAAFVGLFQTPANYGVLLYEHKNSYLGVVVHEYNLRSTVCYFRDFTHDLKTRNILNLLSFLV
jgi:hypothetical protein